MPTLRELLAGGANRAAVTGGTLRERLAASAGAQREAAQAGQQAIEEPNHLERFLADTIGKVPVLQELFTSLGRPLFAIANLAQGKFGGAARNIGQFLTDIPDALLPGNVIPDIARPEDIQTFRDVLTNAGVGDLGRTSLPLIGEVTGKGALGFGLDVLFDPLRVSRVGGVTKLGRERLRSGAGLAKGSVELSGSGLARTGSAIPAQVKAGERALLQMFNRTVLRDIPLFGGSSVMTAVDNALRGARRLTPKLNIASRPEIPGTLGANVGTATAGAAELGIPAQMAWVDFARLGMESGLSLDEAMRQFVLAAERKPKFIGGAADRAERAAKAARMEEKAAAATSKSWQTRWRNLAKNLPTHEATRKEAIQLFRKWKQQGLSNADAYHAAYIQQTFPAVNDLMVPIVQGYTRYFKEVFAREETAGVAINTLKDPYVFYVTHALTPEAQDFLKTRESLRGLVFNRARQWFSANHASTKARNATWNGMPIPEINDFVSTHMNKAGFTGRLFEENPAKLVAIRARREGQAVGAARALEAIGRDYGHARTPELLGAGGIEGRVLMEQTGVRPYVAANGGDAWGLIGERTAKLAEVSRGGKIAGEVAPGRVDLQGVTSLIDVERQAIRELLAEGKIKPTALAGFEDLAFTKDIADDVVRTMQAMYSHVKSEGFLAHYDKLNQAFKTYVTTPFLEFHMRNLGSAVYINWVSDAGAGQYTRAMKMAWEWQKLEKGGAEAAALARSEAAEMLRKFNAHGGRMGQVGGAETRTIPAAEAFRRVAKGREGIEESTATTIAKAPVRAGLAPFRALARGGERVGQFVEDTVRLAHVLDLMEKGHSFENAILSMKKYQFDYAALTPFEKTVLRRAVPFYAWLRKNTPLQIETLITRPGKASTVAHFQRWLQSDGQGDGPMDSRIVPEWTRRRIYGAKQEGDDLRIISGIGIGLEDLAIFDQPTHDFLASLNPALKAIAQHATGRDFFRGTELSRSERAPTYLRYFEFIPGGKRFLDAIDFKMVKDEKGEEIGIARANPTFLNLWSGAPVASASTRFSTTGERLLRDRPDDPNAILKFSTGLRLQHLPRQQQMRNHMIGMLEAAKARIEELRAEGVTEQHRSFFVERDVLPDDPRRAEAKELIRLHGKLTKALGSLSNAESVGVLRESLRSGNR